MVCLDDLVALVGEQEPLSNVSLASTAAVHQLKSIDVATLVGKPTVWTTKVGTHTLLVHTV